MTANTPELSAILFDLDGTLIDTVPEIADAVNDALGELLKHQRLQDALVQSWVGSGAANLFKLALGHCGVDQASLQAEFDLRWATFQNAYAERCGTNSQPYPGAIECLQALQKAGYRLAVVTNKEGQFAREVINKHGMQDYFDTVTAGDTLASKKPDPMVLWATLDRLDTGYSRGLFIGDSMIDVETGAAAAVRTWAVTYGYHHGEFDKPLPQSMQPERFISGFDQLQALLV